ncbi:acyl-CoA thioesterase [PVC group bacterium]|nr:acyl-CoA thioesterase [PVC group bacterium]
MENGALRCHRIMDIEKRRKRPFVRDTRSYLTETTQVRVRFQEVDSMSIVWHGHYISYFEDARRGFGRKYGIDYPAFLENNVGAPVARVWVDYISPAFSNDILDVEARLYKSDGAKLEFGYEVRRHENGKLLATGGSLQVFSSLKGKLILTWPEMMLQRYDDWKDKWIIPK